MVARGAGKGGGPLEETLVPTRFMLLVAEMIVTIMTFYTKEQNVLASVGSTYSQSEFDDYDSQATILLAIAVCCQTVLLGGLVTGTTMFSHRLNVFHISLSFAATCFLAWATVENWNVDALWSVVSTLCFFPAVVEAFNILSVCCGKSHKY
eukprot:TRINITY_DN5831_c0_g1_i1.p1 TRINITY_DN5831_c0_g1~~TRINITY_DN5831_c0_g1_i1.p1  ORF type:complete len:151 (-),score=34.91 TRINITY_DN5831_c0_g1_i1:403-855(-)